MLLGDRAQFFIQAFVVWAVTIFDAQGRVKFIGLLTVANDRHIHCDQLDDICWNSCCGAVTDLFII